MAAVAGVRIAHATLGANVEDIVTLSAGRGPAEIVHHGLVTDPIYFRLDNIAAVKLADENHVLLPGERLSIQLPDNGIVRLICNLAAGYTVLLL